MQFVTVLINGKDVSTFMRPYLISVVVTDLPGESSDTADLVFDDSGGQIKLPKDGALIVILFYGIQVFEGVVDSVTSSGGRGDGRILRVAAKGFDSRGKAKELQRWHMDDATLQDVLNKAGKNAGIDGVLVDPAFASMTRDYWSPDGASFISYGQKLANELGATFKIRGRQAVFAKRSTGLTISGAPMPTVTARTGIGGNVINWQISPIIGRPRYTRAQVRFFDRKTASFKQEEVDIAANDGRPDATYEQRTMAADSDQAKLGVEAMKTETDRKSGNGSVTMDFNGDAQAEGSLVLIGARPGIDGTYRITSVSHKADRSGGTTTSVAVEQPQGDVGKDERQAG